MCVLNVFILFLFPFHVAAVPATASTEPHFKCQLPEARCKYKSYVCFAENEYVRVPVSAEPCVWYLVPFFFLFKIYFISHI